MQQGDRRFGPPSIMGGSGAVPARGVPEARAVRVMPVELIEIVLLLPVLFWFSVAYFVEGTFDPAFSNVTGCIALICVLALGVYKNLRQDAARIWGTMFWFHIACIAFHGVGSLVPYIGNDATVLDARRFYYFSDEEVVRLNLLNALAIFCVLIGSLVARGLVGQHRTKANQMVQSVPLEFVTVAFVIFGGIARYGVVVPHLFGFGDGVLTSIVGALARAYSAGLMLLIILAFSKGRAMLALAGALVLVEILVGVLLFSKSDVLITIIFVVLAFFHVRPALSRLGVGAVAGILVFSSIAPLIHYGRDETIKLGGGKQIATFEQRLQILDRYLTDQSPLANDPEGVQTALSRVSYVAPSTWGMSLYDSGNSGDTMVHLFAAFVPRFLWPDKPEMTAAGRTLYIMATGNEGTSISVGLFAEAYWNLGWFGVVFLMSVMGFVLGWLSSVSVAMISQERWIFLPLVLIGIQIGTRVDGHFVTDVVASPFTLVVFYFIISRFERVVGGRLAQV